jgi:hypothetical protein
MKEGLIMAIIIGAGTLVSFSQAVGSCAISVNWGYNPNIQRLYCLGSWQALDTISKPTETLNITIYAPGVSMSVQPTEECADASPVVTASVDPAVCPAGFVSGVTGSWYVTSYSFSKDDPTQRGQETWSMMRWVAGDGTPAPTYTLRGISEGQATDNAGVTFSGATTEISSASVSAGSFGSAHVLKVGQVSAVGGGTSVQGETGQGSVSIPYTPLWLQI